VKPGDLVRIDENRRFGVTDLHVEYGLMGGTIFIVESVELDTDPLGPTGNLFITVVDPTDGGKWVVEGNVLTKIV
jgi:hypothetical protein